jgi:galactokinase
MSPALTRLEHNILPTLQNIPTLLKSDHGHHNLSRLYGSSPAALESQVERHLRLVDRFKVAFPNQPAVEFFSSPGRTEVGGNHTDHNAGRILAAAVDLDILALAAPNHESVIRVQSEGYPLSVINLDELAPVVAERYTSSALARGVCARFQQLGYMIGGFDAAVTSRVPKGSGLSSSAAYELLVAVILNHLYNQGQIDPVKLAQISQFSENHYFGKPCGLMDQTTCAIGAFVTIDFNDFSQPVVKKVNFDFTDCGYTLVIVDTWGDHSDLNDEYTALENEMKAVAKALGGQVLRQFNEQTVIDNLTYLHSKVSDRAILRAIHFYQDDQRVVEQVLALESRDILRFLDLIIESGESSWMLCQNCYSPKAVSQQGISIALAASEHLLKGRGAWRVHGGGFAGSIQAFVPNGLLPFYIQTMDGIFGSGSCHAIMIRPIGAAFTQLE